MTEPSDSLLQTLERMAGAGVVSRHAARAVDDCEFRVSLRPPDPEVLAGCLQVLAEARAGVVIHGAGNRLALGNPPRGAVLLLDTRGLAGVSSFEAAEGVCRAGAGTLLADLREKVRAGGWELPLDTPGSGATLGGTIASGAFGPRALGFGVPRDIVLGLDVALASGARTRCGGRVVKNVTGYDLCKLYTGSFGALGLIEAAWLRLRPLPETTLTLAARSDDLVATFGAALSAARRPTARAVAVHVPASGGGLRFVAELAGDDLAVADDRGRVGAELAADEAEGAALDELRALQLAGELVVRVSALATRLAEAAQALRAAGAELLAYPGLGVLYARFRPDRADAFASAAGIARAAGGVARLERAPADVKAQGDVFGEPDASLALQRSLKQRFDPHCGLNPGRSAGWL